MKRRDALAAGLSGALLGGFPASACAAEVGAATDAADAEAALRAGGVVLLMRHALAPGTFDPTGFRLGDCSTQRNLSEEGRAQARRIGAWFQARALTPARVRSSPWCRCVDTATLAFGAAEAWAALGSPQPAAEAANTAHRAELATALADVGAGRFEVWVTHQFVISGLAAAGTDSGEGVLLRSGAGGSPRIVARWPAL